MLQAICDALPESLRVSVMSYMERKSEDMKVVFADRLKQVTASEIRESLKLIADPEMISFAGGNPDPDTFPVDVLGEITEQILETDGGMALQYSPTEGYDPLRKKIADRVATFGIDTTYEDILITSGSQQALSLTGDVFLNEGDVLVCENPTYFGALNAFKKHCPRVIGVETEHDGMNMEALEKVLQTETVKLIYVIPDYQNPTGNSWSVEKRKRLVELSEMYGVPVVEDNPYYEIYYDEADKRPAIKHFDRSGNVIFLGSYSKTFCPGLRIGWVNATPEILNKYVIMKQGADLQTNTLSQRQLNAFLEIRDFDEHVARTKDLYRGRRDLMVDMLKKYFPKECRYTVPSGGFFIWVELPEGLDGKAILDRAIQRKVAYISGASFYPNGGKSNTIRLSYSTMKNDLICEGMKRLGGVLSEMIAEG